MPDYGMGQTNIDKETGIRYGVISQHEVLQAWADSSKAYYGEPHCPKCGDDAVEVAFLGKKNLVAKPEQAPPDRGDYEVGRGACGDWACDECKYLFDSEEAYSEEPLSYFIDNGEYKAECGESGDIFVMKSPYYTYGPFCSPCAPGAVSLVTDGDYDASTGVRAYCFGKDFFDGEKAPYVYYSVDTGQRKG